jgi:hypothetical protein
MVPQLVNSELDRSRRKRPWPNLRNYPENSLLGLRKTTKTLLQNNRSMGQDLNSRIPEYGAGVGYWSLDHNVWWLAKKCDARWGTNKLNLFQNTLPVTAGICSGGLIICWSTFDNPLSGRNSIPASLTLSEIPFLSEWRKFRKNRSSITKAWLRCGAI